MAPKKTNRFINRELSWLEFNQRVLDQALDETMPLLERLKFLAITASNLDEFFMVRVGGLQILVDGGLSKKDPAGLTPAQQISAVMRRTRLMTEAQHACFLESLQPALAGYGIRRMSPGQLTEDQYHHVQYVFENEIFPVLSPIAFTHNRQPSLLQNQLIHLCVRVRPQGSQKNRFSVIPLPKNLSRFITVPAAEAGYTFMLVEDIIALFIERFFPAGDRVMKCTAFRITRNADLSVREDQAPDLLSEMEAVLDARKRSGCVRLEVDERVSKMTLSFLHRLLHVDTEHTFKLPGPLDFTAFMELSSLEGFSGLLDKPWQPCSLPVLPENKSVFDLLDNQDILLYHPYDSFDPVIRLCNEAADDPDVIAIKQILYRTSKTSPIVTALIRAARNGKSVSVIMELKARFDEARNIEWAKKLEDAGAQVIYGIKGLKTHAKICLIIRRSTQGIQRYMHFGTGNYNEKTARLYSDVSYMTTNEDLGGDASSFFNAITGYSQPQPMAQLDAAPMSIRERIIECIEGEIERKHQGQKARIMAKVNSLVDRKVIDALYRASQAGVPVELNIRGICCLRAGVPGLSENISVVSIVDRFLEHARILYAYSGGEETVYISSADWMPRNLDKRIELLVPVNERESKQRLITILRTHLQDNVNGWRLLPDNRYERISPRKGQKKVRSQRACYRMAGDRNREAASSHRIVFEPHKAPQEHR